MTNGSAGSAVLDCLASRSFAVLPGCVYAPTDLREDPFAEGERGGALRSQAAGGTVYYEPQQLACHRTEPI
jgi:hypothetical protein